MRWILLSIEEIRAFFENDRFAAEAGIEIVSVAEDGAVCSVQLRDAHKNAGGVAQGGLIYTLADFTLAVAANAEGSGFVTLTANISYLAPAVEGRLLSTARQKGGGRRIRVYEVEVTDERGKRIAFATFTAYRKDG